MYWGWWEKMNTSCHLETIRLESSTLKVRLPLDFAQVCRIQKTTSFSFILYAKATEYHGVWRSLYNQLWRGQTQGKSCNRRMLRQHQVWMLQFACVTGTPERTQYNLLWRIFPLHVWAENFTCPVEMWTVPSHRTFVRISWTRPV